MTTWLLLVPFISAFGGWVAYRLAAKLFFRAIAFEKKQQLAQNIGNFVNHDSFSLADIGRRISMPEHLKEMRPLIEKHTDQFLQAKVKKTFPVLNVFIRGKTVKQLNHVFIEEMEQVFPMMVENGISKLRKDFAAQNIVADGLASVSPDDLKVLLQQTLGRELKFIQLISIGLGLLTGALTVLATVLILK